MWFDDYEDRVLYDEAGLFEYTRVKKDAQGMINKRMPNAAEAVADIPDGAASWWAASAKPAAPSNCCMRH